MPGHVTQISTTPVKGLGLVHPDAIELGPAGLADDRRFHLIGADGRLVNGKVVGALVRVSATLSSDGAMLELRFPDDTTVGGAIALGEHVETNFYGRPVPGRLVVGPWNAALSDFAGIPLRLARVASEVGGVDRGVTASVSLISTASLSRLAAEAGADTVDTRRFRMLFTIDGVVEHAEDAWVGRDVTVGGAVIRPNGLVGRCAVTTHDPDSGVPTLDTLRVLRGYREDVPSDEPLPFGVWGEVVRPGRIAVGDTVEPG
jgi:uncharacterized protein YcbX